MEEEIPLNELKEHCAKLSFSEVRLADGIKYQDVISSVEIMDPRTDAMANHEQIQYIGDLMESGEIYTIDELESLPQQQILAFMQRMVALEALFLKGHYLPQTIFTTPYIHHMRLLEEKNPVLYVFCLAVLKFVTNVFEMIGESDLKDSDEFVMHSFGLPVPEVPLEKVITLLRSTHSDADAKGWPKIASCILFQSKLLEASLLLSSGHRYMSKAMIPLQMSLAALENIGDVDSDASLDKLFHPMTLRWVPAMTPLKWISSVDHLEGVAYFREVLSSLLMVCEKLGDVMKCSESLLEFILDFSASNPSLLVRCRLFSLIVSTNEDASQVFLSGTILNTLEKTYGTSVYRSVYEGDSKALDEILTTQQKKQNQIKKYVTKPTELVKLTKENFHSGFMMFMQAFAELHVQIIFTALCNRPRFRRRLANLFDNLKIMQERALDADCNTFGGGYACIEHCFSPNRKPVAECPQCVACSRTMVLSALVMDITCRLIIEFNLLGAECNLYGNCEIPSSYVYNLYVCQKMEENSGILYNPQPFRAKTATGARAYPLVVRTRSISLKTDSHTFYAEIIHLLSTACLGLHLTLDELGIGPKKRKLKCASEEKLYKLRYKSLHILERPPYLEFSQYLKFAQGFLHGDVFSALENSQDLFRQAAEKLTVALQKAASYSLHRYVNLLAVAKANMLCTKLLYSIVGSSAACDWTVEIEMGHVPLGNAKLKKKMVAFFPIYHLKRKPTNAHV